MAIDDIESGDKPLAPLLIESANRAAQALDRFGQIVAFGDELVAARAGEIGRRVGEPGLFLVRFRPALGKFGDATLRAIEPLAPGRPFSADCAAAGRARLSRAGD